MRQAIVVLRFVNLLLTAAERYTQTLMTTRSFELPFFVLAAVAFATPSGAQTVLTSDAHSNPLFGTEFVHASGRIWFSALNPVEGGEVWVTDGTSANTVVVGEALPGSDIDRPIELVAAGNKVFYLVDADPDWEVWSSDGTPAGTQLVATGAEPSFANKNRAVNGLAVANDHVLAFADSWLLSVNVATGDTTRLRPANGEGFVAASDFVYAFAQHPASFAEELIRTDGTRQGTTVLAEVFYPDEDVIGIAGNQLLFLSDGGALIGEELYVSDGTVGGTGFLGEMVAGDADLHCSSVTSVGAIAYVGLRTSPTGQCQPWRTDGTANSMTAT